jgi:uncharacterized membrane protein YkoI
MNRKIAIPALIMAAGIATAAGLAYAKSDAVENDAIADLAKAKITLTQAVGAAEAQSGGKATKAELEGERGAVVYQVEVVTADSKVFDVKVDAADGKVLSSKQDQADRGENEDNDD